MIPLEEARAHVLARVRRLPTVERPLAAALGAVLAADVAAGEDVPPFANTAVDGYAVQAGDTQGAPVELRVVGLLPAGAAPDRPVGPGEAIRIMTGAPMPPGADAVVMVEQTETTGDVVRIATSVASGDSVRDAGSDVRTGDLVLTAGTMLRPAHLGVLASIGLTTVPVVRRPRVGVLSTGDELVDDGGPLGPGQIRESNRVMLLGLVEQAGFEPIDLGLVRDDEAALTDVLLAAGQRCDALLTSGGVSMGDFDLVKVVLDRLGDMRWMQIAIKPAKPFAFGTLGEGTVPVFGLPGNPVSSMISFEVLARPALRSMAGHTDLDRPFVTALADEALRRRPDGKLHLVRVHAAFGADGRVHVRSTGGQGSHQLASTAAADGLAHLPDGDGVVAGGTVRVALLRP